LTQDLFLFHYKCSKKKEEKRKKEEKKKKEKRERISLAQKSTFFNGLFFRTDSVCVTSVKFSGPTQNFTNQKTCIVSLALV